MSFLMSFAVALLAMIGLLILLKDLGDYDD